MIHGNQQVRVAQGMNFGSQSGKLRLARCNFCKQNHTADQRVFQSFPVSSVNSVREHRALPGQESFLLFSRLLFQHGESHHHFCLVA